MTRCVENLGFNPHTIINSGKFIPGYTLDEYNIAAFHANLDVNTIVSRIISSELAILPGRHSQNLDALDDIRSQIKPFVWRGIKAGVFVAESLLESRAI